MKKKKSLSAGKVRKLEEKRRLRMRYANMSSDFQQMDHLPFKPQPDYVKRGEKEDVLK